ncbi:hypothetical protein [Enterococcus thailandicus]|uniref:hypothetical protein n=1 Tax=Enterococcus thailandicus TaxID=417368 RepID=UPI0034DD7844
MVDWKKVGKQALDLGKQATEKGLDSFQEWKNDPDRIEQSKLRKELKNYTPVESDNFIFNEKTKQWCFKKKKKVVYSQDSLLSFEYKEDDYSLTKGGASIGKAMVGGALFGGVGAVVGGVTGKKKTKDKVKSMQLVITFRDNAKIKTETIRYSSSSLDRSSFAYQGLTEKVQSDLALLNLISQSE